MGVNQRDFSVLLLVVVLVVLGACAFSAPPTPTPTPWPTPSPSPTPAPTPTATVEIAVAPLEGHRAPNFTLQDLDGNSVSLSDYRGQMVLLNFWATWCGFCVYEMPDLQRVYAQYRERGFVVLGIDVSEPADRVRRFVESNGIEFPILLDSEQKVTLDYGVQSIPRSFLVAPDGVIAAIYFGPVDAETLERYLRQGE